MTNITLCWPVDFEKVIITDNWQDHVARPKYSRDYAGTDLAGVGQPSRASQFDGQVLQAMWSTQGYGNTVFIEYSGVLRTRVAHLASYGVKKNQIVQPDNWNLGPIGSTGNSTGVHVHWETWIKVNNKWTNVDPLDASNNLMVVNNSASLVRISSGDTPTITQPPALVLPSPIEYQKVKCTPAITKWVNLRSLPSSRGADLGDIKPGELWDVLGYQTDTLGFTWFAVKKGQFIGWAAACTPTEIWLQIVPADPAGV